VLTKSYYSGPQLFQSQAPTEASVYESCDNFEHKGSVRDTPRAGRPVCMTTQENMLAVVHPAVQSPWKFNVPTEEGFNMLH
jgi:hypothetical protein